MVVAAILQDSAKQWLLDFCEHQIIKITRVFRIERFHELANGAFNGAFKPTINHSIFWTNLHPDGGGAPEGELAAAIDEFFGSFDGFKAHFTAASMGIQGSGWGVLSWDPIGKQMIIQQLFDQQGNTAQGTIPLLQLDMWEHAFYLDYVNVKADYVAAFWNIVNWENVAARLEAARSGASASLLIS